MRAVHVAVDAGHAYDLGAAWMDAGVDVPLEIIESTGGIAPSVAEYVRAELDHGADEVVVLAGRMHCTRHRWLSHLLHDGTADAIAAYVAEIPRARAPSSLMSCSRPPRRPTPTTPPAVLPRSESWVTSCS